MDEEKTKNDIAEAKGEATTATCIQTALVSMLVTKGVLTPDEAAAISGIAGELLKTSQTLEPDSREMANRALAGFARSWTRHVTRN